VNDPLEHEADAVADKVMRMPDTPFVQRKCTGCKEEGQALQKKEVTGDASGAQKSDAPAIVHDVLASSGHALDTKTLTFMESRFRNDFSQVKIHTDRKANISARDLNATAYTVKDNIVFGVGEFQPHNSTGQRLLAHELSHVLQQRRGSDMTTSGNFLQRKTSTVPETPEILANKMREAFRGLGTDENEVYRILSMPPAIVQAMRAFYEVHLNDHTGLGLIEDIKDEFSGSELGRAMILLSNAGIVAKEFKADKPEQLARNIRKAFRGLGTDEDEVYRILSYPPDKVRAMINYYNDNLNDHTGKGLVEDIKDEFSGSELELAMKLLANAEIELHTIDKKTRIESSVPGEPDKLWAGLIVRGMWSKNHEPGVMEQHADVVIPDAGGQMRTHGYFGDQPGATGSSADSRASTGMGITGISADMAWFLQNRRAYVDLELAKMVDMKSSLILIKVTREQAADLNKYWEDLKADPGTFYILGKNCSTAAAAGFDHAHLFKEIVGLDTPDNLFQQLRKHYQDAFMISGYYGYTRAGLAWQLKGGSPVLINPGTGDWNGPFVVEKKLT
jgi:hypothetical protein